MLLSALASRAAARNPRIGLHGWAPLALAMGYGAAAPWLAVLLLGRPPGIGGSWPFALSLAYPSVAGSVLGFGAHSARVGRIGPARAAYAGVMSTGVALGVSTLGEGYPWAWTTAAGVALAVGGNVLALPAQSGAAERNPR